MMPKRKNVIQQVIVLLAVLATLCSWPAVSGSLKGPAEKLLEERLQTESLFKTAGSTPPTLTTSKPFFSNVDMFSSASVWTPKKTYPDGIYCSDLNCILEYMKKLGASDDALHFTRKIAPEVLGSDGYLETFEDKGRVDLGFVGFPTRANTNGAYVFLNGSPSVVSTEQRVDQLDISGDPNYPMLKKQYPQLRIWGGGAGFVSEHANTDSGQRFILDYDIVNFCHACGVGWKAHVAFDFGKDGTFEGKKFLKLVQDENFTTVVAESATAVPCSRAKTSLRREFDPSIDPYCHGDFILDNIRVSDAAGGGFDISMNVFIRGEADAALEIYGAAGNLVDSTLMPGHRPIPASFYDLFIQNQINVVVGLTDEYPWNDDRDSRQSQMTRDVRVHVPASGRFELTKSSDRAIIYNVIRWAIEWISEAGLGGANIRQRRINDIAITMGTEVADLINKSFNFGDKPDKSAALKIVASVATVFLDPANLDGRRVFQGVFKKAMKVELPNWAMKYVHAGLSGVALEGKTFNTINAYLDLYKAARDTNGAVYWRAPMVAQPLSDSSQIKDAAMNPQFPPIPYEDQGVCPFECCTYRRWIAAKNTAIQLDRNGNSPALFNINKGEWVSALTGVVITTVPGKAKVLRPTTINGIQAKNGEIVYLLTYQGEGIYETWYKGKKWKPYPDMSALEIMESPESTWWVQIKNNKGQVGWSKEPDNFDNRDACG